MGPAEYQDNAAQIITNPTPCFAAGIRHSGLQASLGVLQKQARPDFRNNMKDDSPPYYVFPVIRRPDFMIITKSVSPFSVVFSNEKFSNCSSTVDAGFVKLSFWTVCVETVFKMNTEFRCNFCCNSSVVFRHNPLQCEAIPFTWF